MRVVPENFLGRGDVAKQAIEFITDKFGASTASIDEGVGQLFNKIILDYNKVNANVRKSGENT